MNRTMRMIMVGAAIALVAAACGSSSTKSGSASPTTAASTASSSPGSTTGSGSASGTEPLSYFQAQLQSYSSTPPDKIPGPDTPVKNPGKKSLIVLSCGQATTGCKDIAAGASQAAQALGWSTKTIDGMLTPSGYVAGMLLAVSLHPTVLLLTNIPNNLISAQLLKAKQAGIIVIETIYIIPSVGANGVTVDIQGNETGLEKALADDVVVQAKGNAHVLALALPTYQEPDTVFANEIKKCAACSTKIINVNIASMSTSLAPQVAATLIANPDINYIISGPGDFEPFVAEAIKQAHDQGRVHALYEDCQGPGTTSMETDKITVGCEETGSGYIGYAGVDAALRVLDNQNFPRIQTFPFYMFSLSNQPPGGLNYQGTPGFASRYDALWGIG